MEHKDKFEQVWEKGDYRRGSTAQRLVPFILDLIPENKSINDYGCGTGRAELEILKQRPEQEINMVDIALNALEFDILEHPNVYFQCSDLSYLGKNFPKADWGLCINTLMTVQPDKLDMILSEVKRTCDNLIFEAYDMDDFRLGKNMTTVKKNKEEWESKLKEFWKTVLFYPSSESKRRYIFVCKGE